MKHRGQDAPSYDEAQSTAWLAWLARGMQQHGQTIFLIEQLQPSWLSTRGQRWVYVLTSRLIWGVVVGLIVGLIDMAIDGLPFGLIFGLTVGLIDVVRIARNHSRSSQNTTATLRQIIAGSLLFGLIGGLIGWLTGWLEFGLIFGLIYGLFWTLRSFARTFQTEIQTVETIRFSWAYVPRRIGIGLIIGLIGGLIFGLIVGLQFGLGYQSQFGLINGLIIGLIDSVQPALIIGLIVGLIGGLMSCFQLGIQEMKTVPNQGIRLSLRNGSLMGGVGGLGLGLMVGLLVWVGAGLTYGALGGLCIGLWFGGLDVIQHYIVRILLWQAGAMPRNYARFLDYAVEELNFLQKVGGGYIFVHRYLLEYFAAMDVAEQPVATGDRDIARVVYTGESI